MTWRIPLFDLDYGPEEENAVLDVLRSRWLTMGEVTQRFEQAFAESCGVKHAVAVANGTVALHLACLGIGIEPGDEVIVPALTFVATAACVRYVGATPIFADVTSEKDLTLSPESVESLITPRTRAIILMHYGGYACDMPAFRALANKYHLKLIEDAAHAPGAALDGSRAGSWGQVAAFSFFSNKNLATGEGGMLTTDDDEIAAYLRRLRSHGMTTLTWDRHRGHAWSYDVTDLGYNYRPSEMLSALGLVQLAKLDANNQRRRELTAAYHELLAELAPQVGVPFADHPGAPACHIMPVLLPEGSHRPDFMDAMKTRGIQTSIHYPPIPEFTAYRATAGGLDGLPVTRAVSSREVTLPLYSRMTQDDVREVVQSISEILRVR
ncbi:MAG: DegT/DnrJ/EryC1/StrS aminotransferase [Chloroflexi bacterium HGW-Chloroflexi-6]|nr:MAG: DegT/DnrJ/EryC1/StrS aminotransferase [Chloroflexi bacterium HGW-Chloroflexi-6]